MQDHMNGDVAKCPFMNGELNHTAGGGTRNTDWWPNQLNLGILRMHSNMSDPMGEDFDYAKEFNSLDLAAVKQDLNDLMTDSKDWWPAEAGHQSLLSVIRSLRSCFTAARSRLLNSLA